MFSHDDETSTKYAGPYKRVLLINPTHDEIGAEFMMEDIPLRLEYLAAYIRPNVECVEIVDLVKQKKPLSYFLKKFKPDLVGITLNYISAHRISLVLSKEIKNYGADVVFGGYLATALAEEFANEPNVDYVVRGEGELILGELLIGLPQKNINGISYSLNGEVIHNENRDFIEDLDLLPFPERKRRKYSYSLPFADLEPDSGTAYEMVITSRGCWGRCTFCTEPKMSNGKQRYRSPDNVIAEIKEIIKLHRGKRLRLFIADPNFGGDKRLAYEICDKLIEFRKSLKSEVNIFLTVRTNTIAMNPKLVPKLSAAGVDFVFIGMESPNKEDLRSIKKGGGALEQQEKAMSLMHENGIAVMSCFLIGFPNQTDKDIFKIVEYARTLNLEDSKFSVICPLPGSELYDESLKQGTLLEPDHKKWMLWDLVVKHKHLTPEKGREICVKCNTKWFDDLMLSQIFRRRKNNNKPKRKLYDHAHRFYLLSKFFTFLGDNNNKLATLDTFFVVAELASDRPKDFTSKHPINEYIEMDRFLRILGDKKLLVSLEFSDNRQISWILETANGQVNFID